MCSPPTYQVFKGAVLALGALGILEDLPHRRLADVEVRASLEVTGGDFLVGIAAHGLISCIRTWRIILYDFVSLGQRMKCFGTVTFELPRLIQGC